MRNPNLTPKDERELQLLRDEKTRERQNLAEELGLAESVKIHGKPELDLRPYLKYKLAVERLDKLVKELEADFGSDGNTRTLTSPIDQGGLYSKPMPADDEGGKRQQAWNCLRSLGIRDTIPIDKVHLRNAGTEEYTQVVDGPNGEKIEEKRFMVKLRQVAKVEGRKQPVWYLGGNAAVQVHMNEVGVVYKIDSTLARGARPRTLNGTISAEEAVDIARQAFASKCEQMGKARLRFQKDGHHSDLVYLVKLSDRRLRSKRDPECPEELNARTVIYFVNAKTGEVKEQHQTLRYHEPVGPDGKLVEVKTKSFATIPYGRPDKQSPNKEKELYAELDKESYDRLLTLASMDKDGKIILENETCKVHYNKTSQDPTRKKAKSKKANADRPVWTTKVDPLQDGTFNYKPGQEEYDAILIFLAINFEIEYLKARGLKAPKKPITVFVHDESVRDNAYFDPDKNEIHIGVGSGGNWGLFKKICFDLGVTWHEAGHWVVWLQTPGQDLPGDEGGAMHESTGDMMDIIMDLLYIATYLSKITGEKFTKDTIRKYHWIIGYYCLAPDGIRNQREPKKVYPKDMENEVHNDGLISGQACVQVLLDMCDATGDDVSALDILDHFARIYLGALAIVPADKVKFADMLRAMITADREIFGGRYRESIEHGWKDHGVTLDSSSKRKLAA
ncbi:MAG: PepSY domain-containing protein [Candidatus Obscuribacterales bacterium]|nr:PepSY domain-containing protein [Candidatus Obscuribacterales bacterium]